MRGAIDDINWTAERQRYRADLFDDYLPFHDRFVVDHKMGGFHCAVRPSGELVSYRKVTWFLGRGAWVYAFLYNEIARESRYLEIAERALKLLTHTRPSQPDELRPGTLTREGAADSPPGSDGYGDLFVAEGQAEFAKATGDWRYWEEAREAVLKVVRRYDRDDYNPIVGKTYLGPDARPFPGARVLGVWMVLARVTTQMLAMRPDAELQRISDRCIDAVMNYHLNPRFDLLNELINHDLSRPNNEYEQLAYVGHAIETLWMVMDEALRRKDRTLFEKTSASFKRHCDVATDRVYGGLFCNLKNVDANTWVTDKILFPHQEALIGSLMLIEHGNDAWARRFYPEIAAYTRAKFPLRSLNSPMWQPSGNRQVDPTPNINRAENYHHPRFLMLNLLAVERIISKQTDRQKTS